MTDYSLRISIFLVFFASLLVWQLMAPKVVNKVVTNNTNWRTRWLHNLSLFGIDALVVRLIQPSLLLLIALHLNNHAFLYLDWFIHHPILATLLAILLLDLAIYLQHRAFHVVPLFWRLHKVHHSDEKIDISTAIRFHPLEIALSLLYKTALIYVFAIPVTAVLLFDVLLNSAAMFNHTNGKMPKKLDKLLRLLLVTPDMHRIHHSVRLQEANSNYGFFLSIWDRLFASYTQTHTDQAINVGMPKVNKSPEATEKGNALASSLNNESNDHTPSITLYHLLVMPFKRSQRQPK